MCLSAKCHKEQKEDKMQLVAAPAICRSSKVQAPFVVPQIFVDYGSRRTSCASEADRRISLSSNNSSRRTSFASDSDRRGSAGSYCSRRTSLASDTDRRGSASSYYSRRTSLASDTDRRGSASSRSSKRDSDIKSDDIEMVYGGKLLVCFNVWRYIINEYILEVRHKCLYIYILEVRLTKWIYYGGIFSVIYLPCVIHA